MKYFILIIIFLTSSLLSAQFDTGKSDKLIDKMCENFKMNDNLSDSTRINILNEKFIFPYLKQFSDSERENIIDNLYFRFQKRCEYFRDYLQRVDPPVNDNWIRLNAKPHISISDEEITHFKNHPKFYYFEYGGERTEVDMDKKYWKETFSDKTNSKLFLKWIDKNKFVLEFIESNNNTRKNFSKKGDTYNYELINKVNNFYWVLVEIPGQNETLKFKLYLNYQ